MNEWMSLFNPHSILVGLLAFIRPISNNFSRSMLEIKISAEHGRIKQSAKFISYPIICAICLATCCEPNILPTFSASYIRTTCCPLRLAKQMWQRKIDKLVCVCISYVSTLWAWAGHLLWMVLRKREDTRTNKYITKMPEVIKFFPLFSNGSNYIRLMNYAFELFYV